MKKLLLLLLIMPIIGFAQLRSGRYFIKLMHNGKNIQYNPSSILMLANGCADFNCPGQFFDLTMVAGSPKIYTIKNTQSGKFLTFSEDEYGNVIPGLTLQTAKTSSLNRRFQQFLINSDKDGIYSIHPRRTTGIMELFVATELRDINSGGTIVSLEYKTPDRNPANYNVFTNVMWNLIPIPIGTISRTTTSTPVVADRSQSSSSVMITPPNNNKLDIDIRTGGDNLEQRDHQENPEITVEIAGHRSIVLPNINKNQTWVNNSLHRITIPLPATVNPEDLKSITITRKTKQWNRDGLVSSDNWTVSNVAVVAIINNKQTNLANYTSARPHNKVFRFKAMSGGDETGEINSVYGWGTEVNLALSQRPTATPAPARATTVVNPIIKIETLTGGDDLRGGNDNLNVLIRLKIRPVRNISLNNINNRQSWGNFTEHTVTRPVSGLPFSFDDIEDIVLRHTGAGGIGADNWYLDKLKISLTIAGETRVLVDQVSAPIHYFKGDSRSKTFQILR
ncbi:MAG: hypothetical protein EOP00_14845 [Pedobacter sp.]|nr:MAG: hypothetical protein EOP00_14845 [Pedobacter sp.]